MASGRPCSTIRITSGTWWAPFADVVPDWLRTFVGLEGLASASFAYEPLLLHGLLPHWSDVNRSDRSRHAYTVHLIEGSAHYPADNWLQRGPDLPLRGFTSAPVH